MQRGNAATNGLTSYSKSLIGTPYKYGGNSPDSGFDCSGFIGHVFRHSEGINLPRTTNEIRYAGKPVRKNGLQVGDLVFFNTLKRKFSHVGIYLGDDRFIHAPSSGGSVRVENMQDNYWRHRYNGARRITLRL
jgi:cell wall-associated NlpC family hydrolase